MAWSLYRSTHAVCNRDAHTLILPSLSPLTQQLVTVEQILEVDGHSVSVHRDQEVLWHHIFLPLGCFAHFIEIEGDVEIRVLCKDR